MEGNPDPAVGQIWDTDLQRLHKNKPRLQAIYSIIDGKITWSIEDNFDRPHLTSWDRLTTIKDSKNYKFIRYFRDTITNNKSRFDLLLENDR